MAKQQFLEAHKRTAAQRPVIRIALEVAFDHVTPRTAERRAGTKATCGRPFLMSSFDAEEAEGTVDKVRLMP